MSDNCITNNMDNKKIVMVVMLILWLAIYQIFFNYMYKNEKTINTMIEFVDLNTINMMVPFFVFGFSFPNHYLLTFIIAIIFEILKPYIFGNRANYVVDPLMNLGSYTIGTMLSSQPKSDK